MNGHTKQRIRNGATRTALPWALIIMGAILMGIAASCMAQAFGG